MVLISGKLAAVRLLTLAKFSYFYLQIVFV